MIFNYYSGYVYTKSPITGDDILYGKIIDVLGLNNNTQLEEEFETIFKEKLANKYEEFYDMCKTIEKHFGNMMYIEFKIINNQIYIISCEYGKRTAKAAIVIAESLVKKIIKEDNEQLDIIKDNFKYKIY